MTRRELRRYQCGVPAPTPETTTKYDHLMLNTPTRLTLDPVVDMRHTILPNFVFNQGMYPNCTTNATVMLTWAMSIKEEDPSGLQSRMFAYYTARDLMNTTDKTVGVSIPKQLEAIKGYGIPSNYLWPYAKANFKRKPSDSVYRAARTDLVRTIHTIPPVALRQTLSDGFPVLFASLIYPSFFSRRMRIDGIYRLPKPDDKPEERDGDWLYHAMVLVGYNDESQLFYCRNSWGPHWGILGNCYIPYEFIYRNCTRHKFWIINHDE